MISTKDIKLKFLGITPVWNDQTGSLSPQQLVALSGLLTYSGKSIGAILEELRREGKDVDKKVAAILRQSSLKGHASMATTPALSFSYEASKFIDSALTGIVFASAIMASGRRTDTVPEDIVYPQAIAKDLRAREIYKIASEKNIETLNRLLAEGVGKDEASKILQYGIYGTGIIQFSVESLATLAREYDAEKEWMPEDVGFLIGAIEKELKGAGIDLLYATRLAAPRNNYPYPNIFKDPEKTNLARAAADLAGGDEFKIITADFVLSAGLEQRLESLEQKIAAAVQSKENLMANWREILSERQQICRDYGPSASIKIFSSSAWRVWGDKKRHRTVPMAVDSVYESVRRAAEVFSARDAEIRDKQLGHREIDRINRVFSIPPAVLANKEFLYAYLDAARSSFAAYQELLKIGIAPRDAVFAVPRGLRIDIVQDYNLYNLIAGYYPLRICSTAEEELRRASIKEVIAIKNLLQERKMEWLARHIVPKCHCAGFCLERDCCGAIKSLTKDYDGDFHRSMHADLEKKFQTISNEIND